MCGFPILSSWLHSGVWYKTPTKRFLGNSFVSLRALPSLLLTPLVVLSVFGYWGFFSPYFWLLGYPVAVLLKFCSWKISFFSLVCLRLYYDLLSAAGSFLAGFFSGLAGFFLSPGFLQSWSSLTHLLPRGLKSCLCGALDSWFASLGLESIFLVMILIRFSDDLGLQIRGL